MWLYTFLVQKLLPQLNLDNDLASQIYMTDALRNVIQRLLQGVLYSQISYGFTILIKCNFVSLSAATVVSDSFGMILSK